MLNIDCRTNKITVTKGDRAYINFRTANYKLTKGDRVVFRVFKDEDDIFVCEATKFNDKGFTTIKLSTENTTQEVGVYSYTIRVITTLGIDETIINSELEIKE